MLKHKNANNARLRYPPLASPWPPAICTQLLRCRLTMAKIGILSPSSENVCLPQKNSILNTVVSQSLFNTCPAWLHLTLSKSHSPHSTYKAQYDPGQLPHPTANLSLDSPSHLSLSYSHLPLCSNHTGILAVPQTWQEVAT